MIIRMSSKWTAKVFNKSEIRKISKELPIFAIYSNEQLTTAKMDNKRLEKVNKLLQKELGDIFQKELKPAVPMLMITVTHVRVTSDLGYANVYLSVFGVDDKKKVVEEVSQNSKAIRGLLGNRVRHQMRVIPELRFFEDDSLDYIENIDNLLHPEK